MFNVEVGDIFVWGPYIEIVKKVCEGVVIISFKYSDCNISKNNLNYNNALKLYQVFEDKEIIAEQQLNYVKRRIITNKILHIKKEKEVVVDGETYI